jgi:glucosamine--fructose-6-phosphate aminotransferase (isomerizing)
MCGIIGIKSTRNIMPEIISGLQALQYRGYDSWGWCAIKEDYDNVLEYHKYLGKVHGGLYQSRKIAIGHSRWATHGENSLNNTQPYISDDKSLALVHNGIITNYDSFGVKCTGESDSEVILRLIEKHLDDSETTCLYNSIANTVSRLQGSFAIVILDYSGHMYGVCKDESLLYSKSPSGQYLVSDIKALPADCTEYYVVPNNSIIDLCDSDGIASCWDWTTHHQIPNGGPIKINSGDKKKDTAIIHHTLSEIKQQPCIPKKDNLKKVREFLHEQLGLLRDEKRIRFIGCGSSYNAGLVGKYFFNDALVEFPCEVAFRRIKDTDLPIFLSQSGETKDILDIAWKLGRNTPFLSITNNPNSTLARLSTCHLDLNCGEEKAVAATKSFTSQVLAIRALNSYTDHSDFEKHKFNFDRAEEYRELINELKYVKNVYILGNNNQYVLAREFALKLQELCYIPAHAFVTQEFKHGPLALVEKNTPVILLTSDDTTKSQIEARGGKVYELRDNGQVWKSWIQDCIDLQLICYHVAVAKGINPDYPRNLAKSITV